MTTGTTGRFVPGPAARRASRSRAKPARAERPGPPAGPFAGAPPMPGQPRHGL